MAELKSDRLKAAEIVRDAGGTVVGRTKLQKVAYLLELAGFGGGFRFEYRHYGPYSEDLADALQAAEAFGLIKEDERQANWGGFYSIFTTTEKVASNASGPRAIFAAEAVSIGAVELELAATAAYLSVVEEADDPWAETARLKPEKARGGHLAEAKKAYLKLRRLDVPQPLPAIV